MIRAACEMTSDRVRPLEEGESIFVQQEVTTPEGVVRVQFAEGWVSMVSGAGKKILGTPEEGAALRRANLAEAAAGEPGRGSGGG